MINEYIRAAWVELNLEKIQDNRLRRWFEHVMRRLGKMFQR